MPSHSSYICRRAERLRGARSRARRINALVSEVVGLLQNLFDANLTLASVQQNDQTRRISAWAAIIALPTVIASIYGLNFRYRPELYWRFGYPLVLIVMVIASERTRRGPAKGVPLAGKWVAVHTDGTGLSPMGGAAVWASGRGQPSDAAFGNPGAAGRWCHLGCR